jgi:hypothetical protein
MTTLNQLIAIASTKKANAKSVETKAYQAFQKADLFHGLKREYRPLDDNGEKLPPESKKLQLKVDELVEATKFSLREMMNVVVGQDIGNQHAKADVVVDGETLLKDVPAVSLIFLEKQLKDVQTYISKIPVLDATENWELDPNTNLYRSTEVQRHRTAKTQEAIVLYPATPEHPAQTQLITKDVLQGYWHESKFSSAWPATKRDAALERVAKLIEAVIKAREHANTVKVNDSDVGDKVMNYLFR